MELNNTIFWVGHACFYIKAKGTTIFIDPFKVSDTVTEKADILLLTHAHFDHTSKEDINRVIKPDTRIIASQKCLDQNEHKHELSKPGFKIEVNGISIEAVRAYNSKTERLQFHPKQENWVGYIIDTGDLRIYHAGDTDNIPEMSELKDIDVALLPMGGTYTMTLDEAAEAAKSINPKTVVPMHYKMILGEEKSKELEKNVNSRISNSVILKEVQEPLYAF